MKRIRTYKLSLPDSLDPYVQPIAKLVAAWSLTLYGMVTLHNLALLAGLIFSCMQIFVLWRKEFRKPKN